MFSLRLNRVWMLTLSIAIFTVQCSALPLNNNGTLSCLVDSSLSARGPTCFTNSGLRKKVSLRSCRPSLERIDALGPEARLWTDDDYNFDTADCLVTMFENARAGPTQVFSPIDIIETLIDIFTRCDEEEGYGGVSDLALHRQLVDQWRVVVKGPEIDGNVKGVEKCGLVDQVESFQKA